MRRTSSYFGEQVGYEAETMNIFARYQVEAMEYLRLKNFEGLYTIIDVIYITAKGRIGKNLPKGFEQRLIEVEQSIYNIGKKDNITKTHIMQETRKLWGELAEALIKADLMFKTQVDAGSMVIS